MAIHTRSARCIVFHRVEADSPERFPAGPYYFKPVHAPYSSASVVGFETPEDALFAAEAFEETFGCDTLLPGEAGAGRYGLIVEADEVDSDSELCLAAPLT